MLEVLRPRVENLDNVIVDEIPIGSGRDVEFEIDGEYKEKEHMLTSLNHLWTLLKNII